MSIIKNGRNMKRKFKLLSLFIAVIYIFLLMPFSASAAGSVTIAAVYNDTSFAQGETFTVDLNLSGISPTTGIGAINLFLAIDPTKIEYVSETHLSGHSDESDWIIGFNGTTNKVSIAFLDYSTENPILLSSCTLATITFRVLPGAALGTTPITLSKGSVYDMNNQLVSGILAPPATTDITILEPTPTPTPTLTPTPTPIPTPTITPTPTPVVGDPTFELNLVNIANKTFVLTGHNLDPNSTYQIWSEEEHSTDGDYWRLIKAYYEPFTSPISGGAASMTWNVEGDISNSYKIYIRIKNSDNEVTQISKQYSARQVGLFRINYLTVDGLVPVDKSIKQAGETVTFAVSADKANGNLATIRYKYYINNNLYSISSSPTFLWSVPANAQPGLYTFKVIAYQEGSYNNNDIYYAKVLVYNSTIIVPELIDNGFDLVENAYTNESISLNMVNKIASGTGANAVYKFTVAEPMKVPFATLNSGNTSCSFEYPGLYQVFGTVMNVNAPSMSDGAIKTIRIYRYGYPSASINRNNILLEKKVSESGTYNPTSLSGVNENEYVRITAPANSEYQYSFWKRDALGYREVQGWSSNNKLVWKPTQAGKYTIQVRVRYAIYAGTEASYEDEENFEFDIQGVDQQILGLTIDAPFTCAKRVPVIISASSDATFDNSNIMYRFEVYDDLMGTQIIQDYSMVDYCTFIPRKAGTFKIRVRAKDARSFGYYDTFSEQIISVS